MIDKSSLKKWVLPNLPYAVIFWLANKVGEAIRVTPGADFEQKFFGFSGALSASMSNPLPSFNPQDLLVGLISTVVLFLVVLNKKKNAKKYRKDVEYGSARWGAYC